MMNGYKNNKLTCQKVPDISSVLLDPGTAVGYFMKSINKYDPGFSFFRYMRKTFQNIVSLIQTCRQSSWTIVKKYDYKINTITLPFNLKHEGESILTRYTGHMQRIIKSIGLDYKPYIGKKVDIEIYRLRESLPDFMNPRMNARGITLKYDGKIIGAYWCWRHDCFACSLDRKTLKDITNMECG